jgi:hypothetical protein
MNAQDPTVADLAAELRGRSAAGMSDTEAAVAARNLANFMRLLTEIDRNENERGGHYAGDGSGHRIHKAEGRFDRVRKRRPR